MMKRLLLSFWACLICMAASAYDFEVDGLCYDIISIQDHTVEVAPRRQSFGYDNYQQTIFNIPSTVEYQGITWNVIGIGYLALQDCTIDRITLPSTLQYLGHSCFMGTTLQEIDIPKDILIDGGVFWMTPLQTIDISMGRCVETPLGNSPTPYIYDWAKSLTQQGYSLFTGCYNLTTVKLPENLTSIGEWMFNGCHKLVNVTIPLNVSTLCFISFKECNSLKEINSPQVKIIDNEAFEGCRSLERLYLGNVEFIGEGAFTDCPAIKDIILSGTDPVDISETSFTNGHYVYTTLWVPEGTADKYKEKTGWKNFLNIKEGTPDDAKFAVLIESSEDGYSTFVSSSDMATQHMDYIDKGADREIIIEPNEDKEIESVTVNGEDVTNTLVKTQAGVRASQSTRAENTSAYLLSLKNVTCAKSIKVTYKDNDQNGINNIGIDSRKGNDKIYSLDGKMVTTPKSGIFIQNNRKFVVK